MPLPCTERRKARAFSWLAALITMAGAGEVLSGASVMQADAAQGANAPVVLELFTSQGCNSCPPADALLERYTQRDDVVALSLPVDYWDRLGWKDTFGSRQHTNRQRDYAQTRGDGQIYTPQIVAGGLVHALGSSARDVDQAIADVRSRTDVARVGVAVGIAGDEAVIALEPIKGDAAAAEVIVAAVQARGSVAIRRGENAGHTITYHNVVRSLQRVGAWDGTSREFKVPLDTIKAAGATALAVIVQRPGGAIYGAALKPMVWSGS